MGSQEPSERVAPDYTASDGLDAAKLVRIGGTVLDPWQSDILDDWLGRTPSGKWAAPSAGGSVPRQNGKSLLIQARSEAGMLWQRLPQCARWRQCRCRRRYTCGRWCGGSLQGDESGAECVTADGGRFALIRRCGGTFSLRAKSRLRRLRYDTRLRAQPLGGRLERKRGNFLWHMQIRNAGASWWTQSCAISW